MSIDLHGMALVAVVAAVTMLIRFLPFLVFGGGRPTPRFITYLAGVLPCGPPKRACGRSDRSET
jgi:branched-subunit amino acid transport protein AzlD